MPLGVPATCGSGTTLSDPADLRFFFSHYLFTASSSIVASTTNRFAKLSS